MKMILPLLMAITPLPAVALSLAACERVTHISHGGEEGHRDLGDGRVLYTEWWSQEGVARDVVLADCGASRALKARIREQGIGNRPAFDQTTQAFSVIETELAASPALFSLERLALALKPHGRDITLAGLSAEPCACAALYPELRGETPAFELDP